MKVFRLWEKWHDSCYVRDSNSKFDKEPFYELLFLPYPT